MEAHYNWKSKIFSNSLEIVKFDMKVGEVTDKSFSRSIAGELNGRRFLFEVKGFFRQQVSILNLPDESLIAEVKIGPWRSKAYIQYKGREYIWQHENFWNTRWNIGNENGALVKYHSSVMKGEILSYTDDELLILAGIFIKTYFKQRAAAAAAAT